MFAAPQQEDEEIEEPKEQERESCFSSAPVVHLIHFSANKSPFMGMSCLLLFNDDKRDWPSKAKEKKSPRISQKVNKIATLTFLASDTNVFVSTFVFPSTGPVTVPMVSQSGSPSIPMPVQVPPGHLMQQVVDENGTLRHVILSPAQTHQIHNPGIGHFVSIPEIAT